MTLEEIQAKIAENSIKATNILEMEDADLESAKSLLNENEELSKEEISLNGKRALLVLAAEHDRVDILKSILQPTSKLNGDTLAQLLLNNQLGLDDHGIYTRNDLESVFLPPLHIAIAFSAANAASCLLRMGSDPSIRPEIPDDWEGPKWKNENGAVGTERYPWKMFHGMSAWELAFGTIRMARSNSRETKKGWFGFRSASSSKDLELTSELYIPFKIDQAKLEGIKHAFTAEALRAIGSDEVERLQELIDSGMGSMEPIEIGGKDLHRWCLEMGAKKCTEMLKSKSGKWKDNDTTMTENGNHQQQQVGCDLHDQVETIKGTNDDTIVFDSTTLQTLKNKYEESK
jgi:hypothetical protein